jgi:shikimate dehydrogenase
VVDLVYPRPPGGLLDVAAAAGHPVQDGLPMLLWQGVRALEHWLCMSLSGSVVQAMREAIGAPVPPGGDG